MKILYYYGRLNIGGAEWSSVRLLNALVQHGHQVDLLVKWKGGDLEPELDTRVGIIALKKANKHTEKYSGQTWRGLPLIAPLALAARVQQMLRSMSIRLFLFLKRPRYDLALVGYHGLNPAILSKVCRAQVYAMMMRHSASVTDHERQSAQYLRRQADRIDAFICVSQYVRDAMIENYPDLMEKAYCIYNILPSANKSETRCVPDLYKDHEGKLLILTLCRIDAEHKGLFRMIEACKELTKTFDNFVWFIIGDGKDKQAVSKRIIDAGLQNVIIMHPKVSDPLPYYQYADLVAVLSKHEGLCGVVNEAKMMEVPLIATRFSAIDEQINHTVNGYIVDNNLSAIIDGMSRLLTDHDLRQSLANNGLPDALLNDGSKVRQLEDLVKDISGRRTEN